MHFESNVEIVQIERDVVRAGFAEPFRRVSFSLRCEGIEPLETAVWVHPSFPDEHVEAVARAFLGGRLVSLADQAGQGAMSPEAVDALWQSVKPEGY